MRVEVYFNLHKKLFSVRDCKTGRVVKHTNDVTILEAKFVVRKAGRERVLRERKKNVHAFVRGMMVPYNCVFFAPDKTTEVTYNPYKYSSFVNKHTEEAVDRAKIAVLSTNPDEGTTMRALLI
tara:strand:+ start:3571 stop:3939 length:369 start_codon:yes stop_codon:yes gene_type:complete